MEPDDLAFRPNAPASTEVLASLKTGMVKSLPETYLASLIRANGGEGFIGERYVRLWRAEEVIDSFAAGASG